MRYSISDISLTCNNQSHTLRYPAAGVVVILYGQRALGVTIVPPGGRYDPNRISRKDGQGIATSKHLVPRHQSGRSVYKKVLHCFRGLIAASACEVSRRFDEPAIKTELSCVARR